MAGIAVKLLYQRFGAEAGGKSVGPPFGEDLPAHQTPAAAIQKSLLVEKLQRGLGLTQGHLCGGRECPDGGFEQLGPGRQRENDLCTPRGEEPG
ncbi:hypothetical protein [Kocuria rhizophila]|uniref:hypothetical protein n=1 Tax=Kocuria rhizophila TaxID=72000 RepID=UPI00294AE905|nr:hypothetical protein [Kocuria rhizophila]